MKAINFSQAFKVALSIYALASYFCAIPSSTGLPRGDFFFFGGGGGGVVLFFFFGGVVFFFFY
jgi:hypothetical protein